MENISNNITNNNGTNQGNTSVRGWSWGDIKMSGTNLEFQSNNQNWFSIPYNTLSNVLLPSKNEIALEFNLDEETDFKNDDVLCEMRLFMPNKGTDGKFDNNAHTAREDKMDDDDAKSNKSQEEEEKHSAELFKEEIMKFTNIGSMGEAIAHVPEIPMITPRGKFDLYMMKNLLKIHGPSHDYKIPYKNISRSFLLPKPDGHHIMFVVGLISPLRQGNTQYPFLVFQFKNKVHKEIILNLPEDENERKAIFKSELTSPLTGELFDIVAKLFKSMIGVGIIIPGSFKSSGGQLSSIKCSLKANDGYLYPLEKCLIFIHKPVVYIPHEDIRHVECSRVHESNMHKSFDLNIVTKKEEIQFLGIERSEFEALSNYFSNKKIKIKSTDNGNVVEIKPTVKILFLKKLFRLMLQLLEDREKHLKMSQWIYLLTKAILIIILKMGMQKWM